MRNINWDEPLSPEDRAWAEQRPDIPVKDGKKIADLLAEIDGREAPAKNREERRAELRTLIADSQNELARLDKAVNGERPEGAPGQVEQYTDEKYWTLNRLKDELRKRNSDRQSAGENPFPLTGNRSELVERLKRDDEELAAQEGE